MRLPCVRFTVGGVIFAVAVAAVNLWVLRDFCAGGIDEVASASSPLVPGGVGALPLFNVALIGAWFFAVRRFRSLRHGRAASPRSSLGGVAYFSLHFLALGALTHRFMPDAIQRMQELPVNLLVDTPGTWEAVFGETGALVMWVIVYFSVMGALLSGLPLLFSWIGRTLARRSAARLPRRRFQVLACLVSLGFGGVGLAICLTPQTYKEQQEVALDFQVVDAGSGQPVKGAFVSLTDPLSHRPPVHRPRALTDGGGRVRLTSRFRVEGERNAFHGLGVFSPWGRWVEVSAVGYATRRIPLTEVLGLLTDAPAHRPGKVALARGTTPADSFRDLAGTYENNYLTRSWLEVTPDGRYALGVSACFSEHEEYGYVSRHNRLIELHPIPQYRKVQHSREAGRYWAVSWGPRLYLVTSRPYELREFCQAALRPDRSPASEFHYVSFHRECEHDIPRTGLPRLPLELWVQFLANEINLEDEEGALRRALDALVRRLTGESEDSRSPPTIAL